MNKLKSSLLVIAASVFISAPTYAADIEACLITKTDINPFFVKMKEGAKAKADELGIKLSTFAGKIDGDHETQVKAVETCIASGAKGILIAASDTKAIVPVLKNAQDNGLLVIALDTPLEPITAADSTFATDNFKAGELGGAWVAAKLGPDGVANAKIAMLDLNESQPSVGVLRDQGFLTGFGIDVKDVSRWGIYKLNKKLNSTDYLIKGVVEKPNVKEAPSNKAVIGRYILPKSIFLKLKNTKPSQGGEIHITDAIQSLIDSNEKFIAHNFLGKYLDCGTMSGYINSSKEISKL